MKWSGVVMGTTLTPKENDALNRLSLLLSDLIKKYGAEALKRIDENNEELAEN